MAGADYQYCPMCATPLVERALYGRTRRTCPACGFVRFHDPKVAVIALITSGDRVLLIQRGVNPEKGKWALPGGYMDAGEMPEPALRRELREEIRLEVEVLRFLDVFAIAATDGAVLGIVLAYATSPAGGGWPQPAAEDDVADARWFSVADLPADLAFDSTRSLLAAWSVQQIENA